MIKPDEVHKLVAQAFELSERGDYSGALALYNRLLVQDKDNQDALFGQALCYAGLGHYELALQSHEELEKRGINDPCLCYNKALVLARLGRQEDARRYLLRATEMSPTDAESYRCRGNAHDDLGNTDMALAEYAESLKADHKNTLTYLNRANVLRRIGRPRKALADIDKAIELRPDFAEAHIEKAECLSLMSRVKLAITVYDKAISLNPNLARAYMDKGWLLESEGRFQAALDAYDQAIQLMQSAKDADNLAVLWFNKGNIFYELDRLEDALKSYRRALDIGGDDSDVLVNMGQTYEALGQDEEAVECYKRSLELQPSDDIAKKVDELTS